MTMWREGRFLSLDDFFLRRRRGDFPVTPSMYLDRNRVLKRIISPGYPMTFQPRIVVVRAQQDGTALDFMNRLLWILHEDRERAYGLGGPLYLFTNHFVEFMDYTSPDLFDDLRRYSSLTSYRGLIGHSDLSGFTILTDDRPELPRFVRFLIRRGFELIGLTKTPHLLHPTFVSQIDFYVECALANDGRGIESWWWDWRRTTSGEQPNRSGISPSVPGRMDFNAKCVPARADRGTAWSRWDWWSITHGDPTAPSGLFPPATGTHDYSFTLAAD